MKVIPMLLVLATAAFVSCERHDFEETKKLSEPHGGAHGAAHGEHGHGEAAHGTEAGHGEKKADDHGHAEGEHKH